MKLNVVKVLRIVTIFFQHSHDFLRITASLAWSLIAKDIITGRLLLRDHMLVPMTGDMKAISSSIFLSPSLSQGLVS